jgi:hypothetical protein
MTGVIGNQTRNHLGMEAPASPVPPTLAGAFHFGSR